MTALLALTGCAAASSEPPVATVTVTASPEEADVTPPPAQQASDQNKEDDFIEVARLQMLTFGFNEGRLSNKQLLEEGLKACKLGDAYEAPPAIAKKEGAAETLSFAAKTRLC